MPHRLSLGLLVLLGLVGCANAESPQLALPDFSELRSRATDAVDVTIGPLPLSLAGWLVDHDAGGDPGVADAKAALKGLHALYIRHYEFASDFAYPASELDSVRRQLAGAGWSQIVHVRDQKKSEDVDVYLALEKDRITGVAIVANEPREFTIVNAVGSLTMGQVNALREHFGFQHDADAKEHHDADAGHGSFLPL